MSNNSKKLITILLALVMILSLFSTLVFAVQNNEQTQQTTQPEQEQEVIEEEVEDPQEEQQPAMGTVIVRYIDKNGVTISDPVAQEYTLGTYTINAKAITGYNLISPSTQSVTINESGQQKEVVFQYELLQADPEPEPEPEEEETPPAPMQPNEPEPIVQNITLEAPPYKTTYLVGEELDLEGIVIFGELSNGGELEIPIDQLSAIGFNSEAPQEEQLITVIYNGLTAEFTVTIEEGQIQRTSIFRNPIFLALLLLTIGLLIAALVYWLKKKKRLTETEPKHPKAKLTTTQKRKRIIIISLLVIVTMLVVAYGSALYLLGRMDREEIPQDDESLGITPGTGTRKITNVAIFGIDSEEGMRGRSDAIMILTLDEINDKIKITSIMRDSYVNIPGRRLDKINHAYAFGGPELAIKTINQNFGLDIRHFVSVNFTSMPAIIDAVGGVELKITDREAREIPGIDTGGNHLLTGQQALRFSRIRRIDSDFERARRQRDVMESVIRAAFGIPATSYPRSLNQVLPHLTTNLSSNQILNLGGRAAMNNVNNIKQVQFPPASIAKGQIINGVWYYVFDLEEGAKKLSQYIFEDIPIE